MRRKIIALMCLGAAALLSVTAQTTPDVPITQYDLQAVGPTLLSEDVMQVGPHHHQPQHLTMEVEGSTPCSPSSPIERSMPCNVP